MGKDDVVGIVCRQNVKNQLVLATLEEETQKKVAQFNKERTNNVAHLMSIEFIQWLVLEASSSRWSKEDVGSIVFRENRDNQLILATLDKETQKQAAAFNKEKTLEVAHLLNAEFVLWLIEQAKEGNWSKEDVGSVVCRENRDNRLILATLDEETQKQAAAFNKAKTCSAVPYMDADFLQWLYQEAVEGRWDESMVLEAVVKEELDGKASFSPRIKPGKSIVNFLSCPMILTHL